MKFRLSPSSLLALVALPAAVYGHGYMEIPMARYVFENIKDAMRNRRSPSPIPVTLFSGSLNTTLFVYAIVQEPLCVAHEHNRQPDRCFRCSAVSNDAPRIEPEHRCVRKGSGRTRNRLRRMDRHPGKSHALDFTGNLRSRGYHRDHDRADRPSQGSPRGQGLSAGTGIHPGMLRSISPGVRERSPLRHAEGRELSGTRLSPRTQNGPPNAIPAAR